MISKGYVYKEIPILNGYTGYVTEEGLTYFIEKEQNIQMRVLIGEARDLLIELIENKNSDLAKLLALKFEGLNFNEDNRLRSKIKFLIDNGYLNIPKNGWADNVPYFATLTYEGEHYLEFEEEQKKQKAQTPYSITNNGQLNIASENASITASQYNGFDVKVLKDLVDAVKKEISNIADENDIEIVNDSIETLESELNQPSPKKGLIRTALNGLKSIKGTAEFVAAVATLVQFAQSVIKG